MVNGIKNILDTARYNAARAVNNELISKGLLQNSQITELVGEYDLYFLNFVLSRANKRLHSLSWSHSRILFTKYLRNINHILPQVRYILILQQPLELVPLV